MSQPNDLNRDQITTDQLSKIPTTAVSEELRPAILLSEEEMKLVAGAGWFDDVLSAIRSTNPSPPSVLGSLL
jgi:hypothetical protein